MFFRRGFMRKKAIQNIISKLNENNSEQFISQTKSISEVYGSNTFNDDVMKKKLSKSIYNSLKQCVEGGGELTVGIANEVAHGMKEWAIEKGCTHYAHWFQPLTGATAEKHDSFLNIDNGKIIERFSGKELVKQEPDASSFPSGGLRATFEARGYTAWDPTSPAFIMDDESGKTLCIPSVFVTYTGHSLDLKSPLLKSMEALENSASKLLELFGVKEARVLSCVGPEQEYFLVDRNLAYMRQDLLVCGRTLFGARPPKGQELDDQYFGSIKERMLSFMGDVETECYKLGIPLKTRHNEVAPHQYEFAPVYEEANIATDHNQLTVEIMKKKAQKHGFLLLLHEKPFARINGSGKHINWSLNTENLNLLDPGDNPHDNLQFLTFLLASVRAFYKHSALLRASVASASNDHRLGGNEAPPAIISVFLGAGLTSVLNRIENNKLKVREFEDIINLGISKLPRISRDNTDRNRTSPLAFTGNKFEFRAVGSQQSVAIPVTVINTAVAESIDYIYEKIVNKNKSLKNFVQAVIEVLREIIPEIKPVLFEGDNYSESWVKEAKKRKLPVLVKTPESVKVFECSDSINLFEKYRVFSKIELKARCEIELERYCKTINIEAMTCIEMAKTKILPPALKYQQLLIDNVKELKNLYGKQSKTYEFIELNLLKLNTLINNLYIYIEKLEKNILKIDFDKLHKSADLCSGEILSNMEELRNSADEIEILVSDELWQLPKYFELLFID